MKSLKLPLLVLLAGLAVAAAITSDLWKPALFEALGFETEKGLSAGGESVAVPPLAPDEEDSSTNDQDPEDMPRPGAEQPSPHTVDGGDLSRPDGVTDTGDTLQPTGADASASEMKGTSKGGTGAEKTAETEAKKPEEEQAEQPPEPIKTVEGQQINPNLAGYLQRADPSRIQGFVFDKAEREAELWVTILIDEAEAFEIRAERREENKQWGVIWHFLRESPVELQDGEQHTVRAFVVRKDRHGRTELNWSPRTVTTNNYPRGKLEEASPEKGISGYAWDPDQRDKPINVVIKIDGEVIATLSANTKNPELVKRRIAPRENCAFKLDWPQRLDDGLEHTVQALAVDTADGVEVELDGSPRLISNRAGTVNAAPIGAFDICNRVVLAGWAYDEDAFNGPVDVEIHIDGERYMQIAANSTRETLRSSKVTPDPDHGFVLTTPGLLLDGKTHTIRVFALNYPTGVKVELEGSPKQYKVEENTPPMGGYWHADENMLRGWAADPDLGTEPCEIEIYIDGKLWKRTKADHKENWLVGTGFAENPEHGIYIKPPDFVKDGEKHEVQILAINFPEGPARNLGTRTIGVASIFPGFWTSDSLLDTRIKKGLYVTSVSPWFDAYHKDVKKGDVLLEYDGIEAGTQEVKNKEGEITTEGTMSSHFRIWLNKNKKKNDSVKFKFWRDGETYEVEVKMGQLQGQ